MRAERSRGGGDDGVVAQRIAARLHEELARVIGSAGLDVLFRRSLVLARRAHPALAGVTAGPRGALAGLDDGARDRRALGEGATAVVAHFMELLVVLIGEDLAMRLVRDLWPEAAEEMTK